MRNNRQYLAAVVGLGNIGMGYDYSCSNDALIMTHSSAYSIHPGYDFIGAVDPCSEKRALFQKKYNAQAYASIEEMCSTVVPEVFSIAVPTEMHHEIFCKILNYQPKAILCEKPISDSIDKAIEMRELATQNNIVFLVNYMRRFEPGVQIMLDKLKNNVLGKINKVIVKYSNGFLNCATHFLDLIQYMLGNIENIHKIGRNSQASIENIDVQCQVSDTDIYLIATEQCDYRLYEVEIIGEKGICRYYDAGRDIRIQLSSPDSDFDNAITLNPNSEQLANEYNRFQWHVVDALYKNLLGQTSFLSNVNESIKIVELASQVLSEEFS